LTLDPEKSGGSPLVIDTSAVINILGCGAGRSLLRSLGRTCIVEERVLGKLTYHPIALRDAHQEIQDLVREGLLNVVRMDDDDYELFLELSASSGHPGLGVGESAAIAIAARRGHFLVLDDRKARRRTATRYPELRLITSAALFLEAANAGGLSIQEARAFFTCAINNAGMCILKEERSLVVHLNLDGI
jgi:predicted nucleic acid-binding protein